MVSRMISTLFILANLWVTTEEGLIDGVTFCISQVATLFEWFLLTAFLAAFVTALCATEKKAENITEDANTLDPHLPDFSKIEVEEDNEKSENVQDMNGNKIRRRPSSLRDIWGQEKGESDFSENLMDFVSRNEEDKVLNDEQNNPIGMQTSPSGCKDATFTDAIAETLVRDLLKNTDNDDIERVLDGKDKRLRPNTFSGFWRQLPGKGDTKKVRNIWNLEDDETLKDEGSRQTVTDVGDWKKKDSLQQPTEYWLSDSLQELAKTWTLEKLLDENSHTNPSTGVTSTMHEPTEDEHGANWAPPKRTGLGFQISEGCLLNNPWLEEPYMRRSKATLSDKSSLSIQRPIGLDFEILDSPIISSFSPPCCPGLGNPLPDTFDSNVSNTLSENLGLLGIWVGSEDNFLQIRLPLVEEFANEDTFPEIPSVEGCTTDGFFFQAQAPYDVQDV